MASLVLRAAQRIAAPTSRALTTASALRASHGAYSHVITRASQSI